MRVLRATDMGMCFGVRDALAAAEQLSQPTQITIHGQLVHNPVVLESLRQRGFVLHDETHAALPRTAQVLITAHGISDRERQRLAAAGKELIDTTCPLVRKAHTAALQLARDGYHVLVVGQREHVEVRGLTGDLASFDVLQKLSDVRRLPHQKLGILAQTTTTDAEFHTFCHAIGQLNPQAEIKVINTICQPTKDRQDALADLLTQVDVMVIVGGHQSNNTRKLAATCRERGIPAYHVADADELLPAWFRSMSCVGLTAGTSTLPETIEAVYQRLIRMSELQKRSAWRMPVRDESSLQTRNQI